MPQAVRRKSTGRASGTQRGPGAGSIIDVCAKNEPSCNHFAAESGLPLGALGPFAAQRSIGWIHCDAINLSVDDDVIRMRLMANKRRPGKNGILSHPASESWSNPESC
jgi:hypothetical protein